jgi:lipoprotein-anchoring transpeptidase ErfK/SrfK
MPSAKDMKLLAAIAVLAIVGASAYLLLGSNGNSPAAPVVVTLPTVTAPVIGSPAPEHPSKAHSGANDVGASVPVPHIRLDPAPDQVKGPSFPIATVAAGQRIALHKSPGGTVLEQVGDRTEFGSARVYWIEQVRGSWFGVPTPDLPNGRLAWIRDDRSELSISQTHFWIRADLSSHRMELHYAKRLLNRFPVTVGSRTSPTPLGNYAVTDGLAGSGLGPWYGCCILALTGHQTNLPSGWIGGDRIAIHGTPGPIGGADSHGCLRASDADMRSLFAHVPLGTPVFIHA